MKSPKFYGYESEINNLVTSHPEVILALYLEAFNDGMRVGQRNAIFKMSVGIVAGAIVLYTAISTYLDHKKNL